MCINQKLLWTFIDLYKETCFERNIYKEYDISIIYEKKLERKCFVVVNSSWVDAKALNSVQLNSCWVRI